MNWFKQKGKLVNKAFDSLDNNLDNNLSDEYIREHRILKGKFADQQFTSDLSFRPSTINDYKITLNGITYISETPEFEFILEKDLVLEGTDFGGLDTDENPKPLFESLILPKCTVTKSSRGHFWWQPKIRYLDVSKLDTSNLINATNMFYDYLEQNTIIKGIDDLDYSNVEKMTSFVNEARISYNPTLYNLSKCKHIGFLFSYKDLNLKMTSLYAPIFETCEYLFWGSSGTVDFTGYSFPNNATNLEGLFKKSNVNIIGMENLDVSNVTKVSQLFYEYTGTPPKFNKWTTSQITNVDYMFAGIKTEILDLTGLTFPNCTSAQHFCSATLQGKNSPITTIKFGNLSFENLPFGNESVFCDLNHLTTITGTFKWSPNSSIDFGVSPLTNNSAMVIINSLPETENNVYVQFKKSVYDSLTEEQIATATSKGWTVKSFNN